METKLWTRERVKTCKKIILEAYTIIYLFINYGNEWKLFKITKHNVRMTYQRLYQSTYSH